MTWLIGPCNIMCELCVKSEDLWLPLNTEVQTLWMHVLKAFELGLQQDTQIASR
jgi:hypothetical protein